MRSLPASNENTPGDRNRAAFARWHIAAALLLFCGVLIAALVFFTREPREDENADGFAATPSSEKRPSTGDRKRQSREVYATWYDVPLDSLAKRRAGLHEFTAAHDKLPLGTRLRVTHLENGKSVIVRITDRGIGRRKVKLDICREAADELEMVSKGVARVRMEVMPEDDKAASPEAAVSAPKS